MTMTKDNSPVGSTVLGKKSGCFFEYEVLMWSEGGRLKVKAPYSADGYCWYEGLDIPLFVEVIKCPIGYDNEGLMKHYILNR